MQVVSLTPSNWKTLSEIPQQYLNHFAFARKSGDVITKLHPWIKCRDYLLDGLFWTKFPNLYKYPIYGYPRIENVNTEEVELLFNCENGRLKDQIKVLNDLEDELEISHTEVEKVGDDFYIKGDGWWMKSTLHLSTYTLILRTLSYVECSNWKELEERIQKNFSSVRGRLKKVILALKISGYDNVLPHKDYEKLDPYTIHNTSGIINFLSSINHGYDTAYNYGNLKNAYLALLKS